jgi:hypothetical protein
VRERVPELPTTDRIGKKEGTTFSSVLQEESSHWFLLVEREIFSHVQRIRRDYGK